MFNLSLKALNNSNAHSIPNLEMAPPYTTSRSIKLICV